MLEIIRQVRPTWIIGENVIGIASMVFPGVVTKVEDETALQFEDHRVIETEEQRFVIGRICEDLKQAGYSVQPLVIPACSIGAPHKRDRVWFVARLNETGAASDTSRLGCHDGRGDRQRGLLPNHLDRDASQSEPQRAGWQRGTGEIVTGNRKNRPSGTEYSLTLNDLAKSGLLPTPVASDRNGGSIRTDPNRQFSCALQDYVHGVAQQKDESLIGHSSQLNPLFTLEMMGFPANWLDSPYHIKNGEPKR